MVLQINYLKEKNSLAVRPLKLGAALVDRSALLAKISPRIKLSILLFYQTFHCINHSQNVPVKIKKINFALKAKCNLISLENVSVTTHEQPTPLGKS